METTDGGPAFPWTTCSGEGYCGQNGHNDGMSLRDYFAGQLAIGFAAHQTFPIANIASKAYSVADAMLEARRSSQR